MDEQTILKIFQLLRMIGHAVTATYLLHLFFIRQRDKWLYLALALQFGIVVVWGGLGVIDTRFEHYGRPLQTPFVIATVFVIIRDFLIEHSSKQKALRRLEGDIRRKLHEGLSH